jgi:hypothetical protein
VSTEVSQNTLRILTTAYSGTANPTRELDDSEFCVEVESLVSPSSP